MEEQFVSTLIGLAVCDSLGTAVEFMPRDSFIPVEDLRGGGKFDLLPGQWTDDTSMSLCLSESLIECGGFNAIDQATRYYKWFERGHLSSNGECFDIGVTTQKALFTFKKTGNPYSGPVGAKAAGNGCLMRLAPIPLAYWKHPLNAIELAGESAKITHGAPVAIDACKYYAGLIIGCLYNETKEILLSPKYSPPGTNNYWNDNQMCEEVSVIANGSFKKKTRNDIKSTGYIIHSMEAALWSFNNTNTFEQGALLAVNLGDDADTVGAIYGQLAGAYYRNIPKHWTDVCTFNPLITLFANELFELSKRIDITKTDNPLLSHDMLSTEYRDMKLNYFDKLEEDNRTIIRYSNPCPKQYKSVEEFDVSIDRINSQYNINTEWSRQLLSDYNKQWNKLRTKLSLRINRKTL